MTLSTTLVIDTEVNEKTDTTPPCNEHDPDNGLLEEHWDCFDAPPYFAAVGPFHRDDAAPEPGEQQDLPSLKAGEVYGLLDFCCHRAPAWYRSEVNRTVHLTEPKDIPVADGNRSCDKNLLDIWESSHKSYLEQQDKPPTEPRASTPSLIVTITTKPTPSPHNTRTRVQPSRNAKRKAPEPEDSKQPRVTIKRRKTKTKGAAAAGGTYHISKPAFSHALHLHLPATVEDIHGKICHRSYRSFRNRLIARVTSKMVGIYSRRRAAADKKPKPPRRCVLQGRETAGPWCCETGKPRTGAGGGGGWEFEKEEAVDDHLGGLVAVAAAPEPDMLASPSCANWPPLPKARVRMAKEEVEQNVVEFEGLKFLVDVCGEPPVPRVMML